MFENSIIMAYTLVYSIFWFIILVYVCTTIVQIQKIYYLCQITFGFVILKFSKMFHWI